MNKLRNVRHFVRMLFGKKGTVNLVVTRRCNLACPYCGNGRLTQRAELAPETWKRIIRTLSASHRAFVFTGGEPLLYDGIFELVGYAADFGLTGLATNAGLLTDETIARLSPLTYLGVSCDGPASSSGKNLDDARLEQIGTGARRVGIRPSLTTTITKENLAAVETLAEKAARYGFWFEPQILVSGDGPQPLRNKNAAITFRTPEEIAAVERVMRRLASMKRAGFPINETYDYLKAVPAYLRGETVFACDAGDDYLCVGTDGRIMACHDAPPTAIFAQEIDRYDDHVDAVRASIPRDCRCCWDCYLNYSFFKRHPLRFCAEYARNWVAGTG
jgi:MoaA/NifB/PqqE/SkfB family radical SAM enzyme